MTGEIEQLLWDSMMMRRFVFDGDLDGGAAGLTDPRQEERKLLS
jgi:hypothetical protein